MTASPTPTSVSGQSNPVSNRPCTVPHSCMNPYLISNVCAHTLSQLTFRLIRFIADMNSVQPVCQNCATSTTPLWRRDELGSVLCNACGLFLKLHGRPRPISLKTDVIKSRNRVKSAQHKKKPMYFGNGIATARSEGGSPPPGFPRASHHSGSDHSHSPISRTTTPAMLGMPPHHMFDPSGMDHSYGPPTGRSPSLPALHFRQPSPNYLDRHLQPPHPYENLQIAHTELKTKASELEVINGLYNDRIRQLEEEHRQIIEREHDYKRQIARLQDEVAFFRRSSTASKRSLEDDDSPFAKRSRASDVSTFSILSNPTEPLTAATKS